VTFLASGTSYNDVGAPGDPTFSVSYSTNVTAGSLGVLWISWDSGSGQTVGSVADSQGQTWINIPSAGVADTTNHQSGAMYYRADLSAGALTVTVTWSANTTFVRAVVVEHSGVATTTPFDVASVTNTTNTTATDNITSGATATLAQANELVISGVLDDANNATFTAGTGYTQRITSAAPAGFQASIEDKTVSATTAVTGTWTGSLASRYICGVATFKLAAGGTNATVIPPARVDVLIH
jgi:hypothetical protein